ncbi:MAG: helix-hairpin-helix domain-containing protein [Tepidisphaeraceae bacterium]|jgi:hypothetical protein
MGLRQKIRLSLGCESRLVPSSPDTPNPKPQTRFSRARRGSVLILVIVLLLMLAILGAAYISTSRGERTSSSQLATNNQIDQHALNIAQAVMGTIIADIADFAGYTHGEPKGNPAVNYPTFTYTNTTTNVTTTYNAYRSTYVGQYQGLSATVSTPVYSAGDVVSVGIAPLTYWMCIDPITANQNLVTPPSATTGWVLAGPPGITSGTSQYWLASRAPEIQGAALAPSWPNITQIFTASTGPISILGTPFESPDGIIPSAPAWSSAQALQNMMPGYKSLANGVLVPTLDIQGTATPTFIAADADGDGVADSLLFRIPGAAFDNLTWYAAVRIIDDNSAINVNTAMSSTQQFGNTGNYLGSPSPDYWGLFPSSAGLQEMFNTTTGNDVVVPGTPPLETIAINDYRTYGTLPSPWTTYTYPTFIPQFSFSPLDDTSYLAGATGPTARTDFNFISAGDVMAQQMARRLENPGLAWAIPVPVTPPNPPVNNQRFSILPWSDSAALAYHFCLLNQNTFGQTYAPTLTENILSQSVYGAVDAGNGGKIGPYQYVSFDGTTKNGVADWYNSYFTTTTTGTPGTPNYSQPSANGRAVAMGSIRQFLVTRNPVNNYTTPVYDPAYPFYGPNSEPTPTLGEPLYTTPMTPGSTPDPFGQLMLPYGSHYNSTAAASTSHYRGLWSATNTYVFNDIVLRNGYTYICIANTLSPSTQLPPPVVPPAVAPYDPAALGTGTYAGQLANSQYWRLQPWTQHPVKANVNTATFNELFRAYWSVMSGNPVRSTTVQYTTPLGNTVGAPLSAFGDITPDLNPYDPAGTTMIPASTTGNPAHQFRSPLRDFSSSGNVAPYTKVTRMDAGNVAILRAAIAAVNTLGLRDNTQNVISRTVGITASIWNSTTSTAVLQTVHARVYSNTPQPFITEVYAYGFNGTPTPATADPNYNGTVNPHGYVAIELYNPYTMPLSLNNWQLGIITRDGTVTYPNLTITPVATLNVQIPAQGYAILENFSATGTTDAAYRPANSGLPGTGSLNQTASPPSTPQIVDVAIPQLYQVNGGGELVILRPRRADGKFTTSTDPLNAYAEAATSAGLADLVPVDSYDLTGMTIGSPSTVFHYLRPKGTDFNFRATWPYYYSVGPTGVPRQGNGLATVSAPVTTTTPNPPLTLAVSWGIPTDSQNAAGYPSFPPIQIYNVFDATGGGTIFSHFPNPVVYPALNTGAPTATVIPAAPPIPAQPPYRFPFGGFARNGDILDVPFVGAYRITTPQQESAGSGQFVEMNALPMDCSFADDGYDATNANTVLHEHIGRFCPEAAEPGFTGTDYYFWARRLLDYLTVENNSDNYLPNTDPGFYDPEVSIAPGPAGPGAGYPPNYTTKYPPATPPTSATSFPGTNANPTQVYNSDGTLPYQSYALGYPGYQIPQDSNGVDGLININTAPAQVLNMLPLVPSTLTQINAAKNWALAQAIVLYRDGDGTLANPPHGPFASIVDLNQVPGFQAAISSLAGPIATDGLLCPPPTNLPLDPPSVPQPRNILEDYQSDFAEVTRISNLVTTHSDTFTVYIVVEGWANAYPPQAAGWMGPPANSPQPQLKVLHRYAFICDRSAISGAVGSFNLKTLVVPND